MAAFHKLKVIAIEKVVDDTVNIDFALPEEIKSEFEFYAGQFVVVKYVIAGQEYKRSYSLCNSPHVNEPFRITIKIVPDGLTSIYANQELSVGDVLDVSTPRGKFYVEPHSGTSKIYYMISAGSGIVPIYSMIKSLLVAEPESTVKLLYGNRNEESIIFGKELTELEKAHSTRLEIFHALSRQTHPLQYLNAHNIWAGRIGEEHLKRFFPLNALPPEYQIFICGPNEMNLGTKDHLNALGFPKEKVHLEYFGKV